MNASLSRLIAFYGELEARALLRIMIREEFPGKIALFSSFGADAAALIALVAEIDPNIPVLFLETQKHFPETLSYVEQLKEKLGLTNLYYLTPDSEMLGRIDPDGELWKHQPNRCCWLRKVEPLQRALNELGIEAIITGRKRYQTPEREHLLKIEIDEHDRFRINPLADWTKEQLSAEFEKRDLPRHPLVEQGYPSIGCAPCTSKVALGANERSGRWAHSIDLYGKQKTECGIHLPEANAPAPDWEM